MRTHRAYGPRTCSPPRASQRPLDALRKTPRARARPLRVALVPPHPTLPPASHIMLCASAHGARADAAARPTPDRIAARQRLGVLGCHHSWLLPTASRPGYPHATVPFSHSRSLASHLHRECVLLIDAPRGEWRELRRFRLHAIGAANRARAVVAQVLRHARLMENVAARQPRRCVVAIERVHADRAGLAACGGGADALIPHWPEDLAQLLLGCAHAHRAD